MINVIGLLLLLTFGVSIPSQYDLRVQPSIVKFTNYELKPEGICSGYAWAKQLAQVLSNTVSLRDEIRYSLSGQQLLECISSQTPVCHHSTKQNIKAALKYIEKYGITTDDCYLNRPLEYPSTFCQRQCNNGYDFPFHFKAKAIEHSSAGQLFDQFKKNQKIGAFAIVKIYDEMNYYSSLKSKIGTNSQFYEYRVAEILGWKNGTDVIILRFGPGENWGYNGYSYLNLKTNGNIIDSYYTFDSNTQNISNDVS